MSESQLFHVHFLDSQAVRDAFLQDFVFEYAQKFFAAVDRCDMGWRLFAQHHRLRAGSAADVQQLRLRGQLRQKLQRFDGALLAAGTLARVAFMKIDDQIQCFHEFPS
jgi:hypothetical protein